MCNTWEPPTPSGVQQSTWNVHYAANPRLVCYMVAKESNACLPRRVQQTSAQGNARAIIQWNTQKYGPIKDLSLGGNAIWQCECTEMGMSNMRYLCL